MRLINQPLSLSLFFFPFSTKTSLRCLRRQLFNDEDDQEDDDGDQEEIKLTCWNKTHENQERRLAIIALAKGVLTCVS